MHLVLRLRGEAEQKEEDDAKKLKKWKQSHYKPLHPQISKFKTEYLNPLMMKLINEINGIKDMKEHKSDNENDNDNDNDRDEKQIDSNVKMDQIVKQNKNVFQFPLFTQSFTKLLYQGKVYVLSYFYRNNSKFETVLIFLLLFVFLFGVSFGCLV